MTSSEFAFMRLRIAAAAGVIWLAWSCVPGGPIYFGEPVSTIRGTVFSLEDGATLARAEVCVFGSDTTCVRADDQGVYMVAWEYDEKVNIRFRITGVRPAMVEALEVVQGEIHAVDCRLSTRLSLATTPGSCHVSTE